MTMTHLINKRLRSILLIVVLALLALVALLMLMGGLARPEKDVSSQGATGREAASQVETPFQEPADAKVAADNTGPSGNEDLIATVNDSVITRQEWRQATRLDAVMSEMALQPVPTAEETLDRLVNEILVLEAVEAIPAPDTPQIEARIELLADAWQISDASIAQRLAKANLSRDDLTTRIARLLQVEAGLEQLAVEQENLNEWLLATRAASEISLYRSLAERESGDDKNADSAGAVAAEETETVAVAEVAEFAPPADLPVAPYPGNAAPDFTLSQLNGEPLTLSGLRGKPVIVNFWATWCPPCRRELPALQAAFETYQDKIGFVAIDVKESSDKVASFVDELGLTFPVVTDEGGQISDVAYEVRGIPTTFFIDASGMIVARHVGPLDEADIARYLEPLLSPPQPQLSGEESGGVSMIGGDGVEITVDPEPGVNMDNQGVTPGGPAPDFTLTAADGSLVSLQDITNDSNLVLVFYRGHT
jgi:cytochrome c biogenesis protein CcmG/thiol:disulfide interchange protein DsbE